MQELLKKWKERFEYMKKINWPLDCRNTLEKCIDELEEVLVDTDVDDR